jgi:hypothetical protein
MTMALVERLLVFLLNVVQRSIIHFLLCSPDHGGFIRQWADKCVETLIAGHSALYRNLLF